MTCVMVTPVGRRAVALGNAGGSLPEPTPTNTGTVKIFFDSRAGGAQDWQAISTRTDLLATFNGGTVAESYGLFQLDTNYDGAGTHACRIDWDTNPDGSGNQSDVGSIVYYKNGASFYTTPHVYTTYICHLGKTASGGGNGATGYFPATGDGVTGFKRFMWYRGKDDGTNRIYWVWDQTAIVNECAFNIDDTSFHDQYAPVDHGIAQTVRWTFEIIPASADGIPDGVIRQWRDGVLVHNNTTADIESAGFAQSEFPTTLQNMVSPASEYWESVVIWGV